MFGLGGSEIIFILLIALLVIGPKNFPKIARSLSQFLAEARRWSFEFSRAMDDAAADIDPDRKQKARATVVKASPVSPDQANQDSAEPPAVTVTQDRPGPVALDLIDPPEIGDDQKEKPL